MTFEDAVKSAAGLCWSEHYRWKTADPKTGAHWKEVAEALDAGAFEAVVKRAIEATKPERDRISAGETVGSDVLNLILR